MSDDNMGVAFAGGCLCGAVRYESTMEPVAGGHCHCLDCRKSSGTGHCSHVVLPKPALTVSGATTGFDKETDSGNTVTRHFCPTCGSPVYSVNSGFPDLIFPRASSLDDPTVFQPQMRVYTKRQPAWDVMDDSLPAFEEMPPPEAMPAEM